MATGGPERLSPARPRPALWLLPALAAMVCGAFLIVALAATPPQNAIFVDWTTYSLGSERVLDGQSLYLPEQLAGPYHLPDVTPQGYVYPPPSAVLFVPFSYGQVGLALWLILNLGLLFSGLAAVVRREFGQLRPVPLALVFIGLLIIIPVPGTVLAPFPNGVLTANVNVALAGLLAWCWAVGSRRGWIPYVAGVVGTFKIFPGALALWAVRRDGWRALAIAIGVAAAIVVVTLPLVGISEWSAFFRALSNAEPTCDGGRSSIACLALPLIGSSLAKILGLVVGGVLLLLALRARGEFMAFVLLTAGMLAAVEDGHSHYLLFGYVLLVIGLCRLRVRRGLPTQAPDAMIPSMGSGAPAGTRTAAG